MTEQNNDSPSLETRETTTETKPGFFKRFMSKRPVQVVLGVGAIGAAAGGVAWKIKRGASVDEIAESAEKVAMAVARLVA